MNPKTAEAYLPCCRPGQAKDPRLAKVAKVAEGDDALRRRLREQTAFDERIIEMIRSIHPPEHLRKKLAEVVAKSSPARGLRAQWAHPAILSAIAGVLLMLGFVIHMEWNRMQAFPGKEAAERMIAITDEMTGVELEPTKAMAGDLSDTFYMRGFEGFNLPAEVSRLPAVGWRIFKVNGSRVAQLAIDSHAALVYMFKAAEFGVQLEKESQWTLFKQEAWIAAIRQDKDACTMIAFRGSKPEMQRFLTSLEP